MENNENQVCTVDNILENLDQVGHVPDIYLTSFSNIHYDYIGSKLSIYSNKKKWAIICEALVFNGNEQNIEIHLSYFGNCLLNMNRTNRNGKEGIWNEKRIELMSEVNVNRLTSNTIYINRKFDSVVINGSKFNICYDLSEYYKLNIDPLISKKKDEFIDITSYLKYLHAHYPHLLFASEESKKEFLDEDIPKLMELNEWYTEDCTYNWDGGYDGTLPSQIETYKMLAKVIVTGDTSYYKPTIKPNTHWSNWEY